MDAQDSRDQLIRVLNNLLIGKVSWSEFAAIDMSKSEDFTTRQIWNELLEMFQDDLAPSRPIVLTQNSIKLVERTLLFLRLGFNYRWPISPNSGGYLNFAVACCLIASFFIALAMANSVTSIVAILIFVCSMIFYWNRSRHFKRKLKDWMSRGEIEVWPFFSKLEYEQVAISIPENS